MSCYSKTVQRATAVAHFISFSHLTDASIQHLCLRNPYCLFSSSSAFPLTSSYLSQQPNVGQGRLTLGVSRLHTITQVGLLRTRDRPRHRYFHLTTDNIQKRQISMPLAGFKPAVPGSDQPRTLALDLSATVTETRIVQCRIIIFSDKYLQSLSAITPVCLESGSARSTSVHCI